MNMKSICLILLSISILSSCASGSHILTGEKRTPVDPSIVKLYVDPPKQYEVIGIVHASSDSGMTQQGDMDYAVAELKNQAAKLGANGIILSGRGETSSSSVGTYGNNMTYAVSSTAQTVTGTAVYVTQE